MEDNGMDKDDQQMNQGEGEEGEGEGGDDYDQYFDDATDIGYLPADHVSILKFLTLPASHAKTARSPHETID
jgi:hypothetical protein